MTIVLKLTFPHRQYHATPWDQGVNSGAVEWPPSPWRLQRALLSVAHTRHPDVPIADVLRVLQSLAEPPLYWLPETRHGHTRHYMPDSAQKSGENSTKLTLDSYVTMNPADPLVIGWPDIELDPPDRALLGELVASLPYLGRAESIVDATLADSLPEGDGGFAAVWQPNPHGLQRLMCSAPAITQAQLEIGPAQMRKSRRLLPEGCRWVSYEEATGPVSVPERASSSAKDVEVVRWRFVSPAPFRAVNALLATDRLRMLAISVTKAKADREDVTPDERHREPVAGRDAELLSGHPTDATAQHTHAHWLWTERDGQVSDLLLWVPARHGDEQAGISHETAARVADVMGWIGLRAQAGSQYIPAGFVEGDLNLVGWGGREVLADLVSRPDGQRGGMVWESATPHLLVRRGKKNQTLDSLALEDIRSELSFRFDAPPVVKSVVVETRPQQARLYRRLRWGAKLSKSLDKGAIHDRLPVWLRVEFEQPVQGPLVLGGLSHFGFGRLRPVG